MEVIEHPNRLFPPAEGCIAQLKEQNMITAGQKTIQPEDLSEAELNAILWIETSPATFVYNIEPKTSRDVFGNPVPGMAIFRKLEKKGLCFQTIEDPIFLNEGDTEPFEFSPTMELTDEGQELARKMRHSG